MGKDHPLTNSLQSKKLYFEAYVISRVIGDQAESETLMDSLERVAKLKLLHAIELEPNAAYLYFLVARLYDQTFVGTFSKREDQVNDKDSMVLWSSRAIEYSPSWLLPYLDIANQFFYVMADTLQGMQWINRAFAIDSNSHILKQYTIWAYLTMKKFESAEVLARKMIVKSPEIMIGYGLLAHILTLAEKNYDEVESLSKKMNDADSTNIVWGYGPLGYTYSLTRYYKKAKNHFLKGLQRENISRSEKTALLLGLMYNAEFSQNFAEALFWADSTIKQTLDYTLTICALTTKAHALLEQGRHTESESLLKYALTLDPTPNPNFIMDKAYLGLIAEKRGAISVAEDFFKEAEAYGFMYGAWRQWALYHYGAFLMRQNRKDEAKLKWEQLINEYPRNYYGYYGIALYYAGQNDRTLALDNLEKSLDCWYPVPYPIWKEPLFKKIRKTKRFKAMMLKHFPPGWEKK